MKLIQLTTPTALPIALDSIKKYLKVLDDDQDSTIEMIAKANIGRAEDITNLTLGGVTRFELILDSFENFKFPKSPLMEVEKVEYLNENGVLKTLENGKYYAESTTTPATMEFYQTPSTTKVIVTFKAGAKKLEERVTLWLNVKVYEDFYNLDSSERSKHIDNYLDSLRIIPV